MAAAHQNREMEFARLKVYAKAAGDEVRDMIAHCEIEEYKNFLDTMYHYTFSAEWHLLMVTVRSKSIDLQEYFLNQASEMRGHYLLAQSDLLEFEWTVSEEASGAVRAYWDYWRCDPAASAAQYIGAVYVYKNIPAILSKEVRAITDRLNLTAKQSRWLFSHFAVGHASDPLVEDITWRYFSRFQDDVLEGAEMFYKHWVSIFKCALMKKTQSHICLKRH